MFNLLDVLHVEMIVLMLGGWLFFLSEVLIILYKFERVTYSLPISTLVVFNSSVRLCKERVLPSVLVATEDSELRYLFELRHHLNQNGLSRKVDDLEVLVLGDMLDEALNDPFSQLVIRFSRLSDMMRSFNIVLTRTCGFFDFVFSLGSTRLVKMDGLGWFLSLLGRSGSWHCDFILVEISNDYYKIWRETQINAKI